MLVKRVEFFQNDNYVRAQAQANGEANRRWNEMLNDLEVRGEKGEVREYIFTSLDYDDGHWQTIDQNGWNWHGVGSVWLRQHINIDKGHAGKPARLLLGTQGIGYI